MRFESVGWMYSRMQQAEPRSSRTAIRNLMCGKLAWRAGLIDVLSLSLLLAQEHAEG
jgi:hypothetical protein